MHIKFSFFFASGCLRLKKDSICKAQFELSSTIGVIVMNVIPQCSGLAEMEVIFNGNPTSKVEVRPSSLLVRPLVLDVEYQPLESRKRRSRDSRESAKAFAI